MATPLTLPQFQPLSAGKVGGRIFLAGQTTSSTSGGQFTAEINGESVTVRLTQALASRTVSSGQRVALLNVRIDDHEHSVVHADQWANILTGDKAEDLITRAASAPVRATPAARERPQRGESREGGDAGEAGKREPRSREPREGGAQREQRPPRDPRPQRREGAVAVGRNGEGAAPARGGGAEFTAVASRRGRGGRDGAQEGPGPARGGRGGRGGEARTGGVDPAPAPRPERVGGRGEGGRGPRGDGGRVGRSEAGRGEGGRGVEGGRGRGRGRGERRIKQHITQMKELEPEMRPHVMAVRVIGNGTKVGDATGVIKLVLRGGLKAPADGTAIILRGAFVDMENSPTNGNQAHMVLVVDGSADGKIESPETLMDAAPRQYLEPALPENPTDFTAVAWQRDPEPTN